MITFKKLKEIDKSIPAYPKIASLLNIALGTGCLKPDMKAEDAIKSLHRLERYLAIITVFDTDIMSFENDVTKSTLQMLSDNRIPLRMEKIEFFTKKKKDEGK